ncbi:RHS repeat-associated core domain-containing protein [Anaerofustis stercorihominis]|uniref:RHS repeat-associated core domain-containing protein n=1 Tax=Anaerofustis stercorihominis TaxID=214853 RepID=UPI00214BB9F6|nr:amidase domain-containing protein [Anaerofustis stercorihominis]
MSGSKETNYSYDISNQMTKFEAKDGENVTLTQNNEYNYEGQRIRKEVVDSSKETPVTKVNNYYYNGEEILYTTDENNKKTIENILDTDFTLRFNNNKLSVYTLNSDGRGSTSVVVDSLNKGVTGYKYDEFGSTEIVGNTEFNNEVCYTGQVYDKETGDYYYNARYYSPDEGRFVTVDTYREEFEEPQSLHLYAYCANNPINFIDPSGHKYDRNKVTKYIEKYAFKYNKNYPNFNTNGGGDCANFVSQCVRYGGIAKNKKWYCNKRKTPINGKYGKWTWSKAWAVTPKLYSYMKKGKKVVKINKKKYIADKVKKIILKREILYFSDYRGLV